MIFLFYVYGLCTILKRFHSGAFYFCRDKIQASLIFTNFAFGTAITDTV